jgi:hypothetical protein
MYRLLTVILHVSFRWRSGARSQDSAAEEYMLIASRLATSVANESDDVCGILALMDVRRAST